MRILVVEDEDWLRKPLVALLRVQGYSVSEARSVKDARKAFRKAQPNLISLAVALPEGKEAGLRLAAELRMAGYNGPIIFVLAPAATRPQTAGRGSDRDAYLVRPFSLEEYDALVRSLLQLSASA